MSERQGGSSQGSTPRENTTQLATPQETTQPKATQEAPVRRNISVVPIPAEYASHVNPEIWGDWMSFEPRPGTDQPEKDTIVAFLLTIYKQKDLKTTDLWGQFQTDFEGWTQDVWDGVSKTMVGHVVTTLRGGGVFINWDKSTPNTKKLADVLEEEDFHIWTDTDIRKGRRNGPSGLKDLLRDPEIVRDLQDDYDDPPPRRTAQETPPLTETAREAPPAEETPRETPLTSSQQAKEPTLLYRPTPPANPQTPPTELQTPPTFKESPATTSDDPYVTPPTSSQIQTLSKQMKEASKYGGGRYEVLEDSLRLWRHHCEILQIPSLSATLVISTALKDKALDYYLRYIRAPNTPGTFLPQETIVRRLKERFETEQAHQDYLTEWQTTTWATICDQNPTKKPSEVLVT